MKKCFVILITAISLSSCYYDVEEELYPLNGTGCDTSGVTYSQTVKPILQSNCYTCHNSSLASGDLNLEIYGSVKTVADNGKLVGTISHAPGFTPMPQSGNKLLDCDINKIRTWVNAGAPNN